MTRTQRFTLAATGLGLFMIFLDALIVNVALPAIQSDFKVGEAGLQWVVTAYSLGMAMAIMSAGTLADIYGRRKLYLVGIALFTAASVACGMASSLEVLNVARAVQGVAAATVNVTSLALVSAAFPDPKLKAWAIGIWTAIASTAMAIGPTLGGFMVQHTGWRSIFLVNVPVGLAVLVPDMALRGGVARRAPAHVRHPRPASVHDGGRRFRVCRDRGPAGRLALGGDPHAVRGRGGGAGGIHLLRAPERGPDDGPDALPRPHVLARDHHDIRRAVRRLRDVARDHAVPAERARVLAHACRVAPVAVQRER